MNGLLKNSNRYLTALPFGDCHFELPAK